MPFFPPFSLNGSETVSTYLLVALAALLYLSRWLRPNEDQLVHIPTMGPTAPVLSYWGAVQWILRGSEITAEGCQKYKGRLFKVALLDRWFVIVNGPKLLDDFRRAAENELSFRAAADEHLSIRYIVEPKLAKSDQHLTVIRELSKNLAALFVDIQDEVFTACDEQIGPAADWTAVGAYNMVMTTVARANNRVFVGLPICRNSDFIKLAQRFVVDFHTGSQIVHQFPELMRRFAGRHLTKVNSDIDEGIRHLGSEIQSRLDLIGEHGLAYPGRPADMLSEIIDMIDAEDRTLRTLVTWVLVLNLASIQTSTLSFTFALYHLALNPDHVQELRDEAEKVTKMEGWSLDALEKLYKADSYLKECLRVYSIGSVNMLRKAVKDFTFSDGTTVPAGTMIGMASLPMQLDPQYYENAETFDPFRFSRPREAGELDTRKLMRNAMTSTGTNDFLAFGHGRHACPGRFFAATQLKLFLTYLVLNYEMKMGGEGVMPTHLQVMTTTVPNPTAKVLFKRRLI